MGLRARLDHRCLDGWPTPAHMHTVCAHVAGMYMSRRLAHTCTHVHSVRAHAHMHTCTQCAHVHVHVHVHVHAHLVCTCTGCTCTYPARSVLDDHRHRSLKHRPTALPIATHARPPSRRRRCECVDQRLLVRIPAHACMHAMCVRMHVCEHRRPTSSCAHTCTCMHACYLCTHACTHACM